MFVEAPSTVVFVIMQMSLGLILNVIVGFSVVDGRWRGREAILDLDFTISHRCKCQFCQKRFSLRVLALRRVCKQMTIVAMRPCCKTGATVVLRRSTTLMSYEFPALLIWRRRQKFTRQSKMANMRQICVLANPLANQFFESTLYRLYSVIITGFSMP